MLFDDYARELRGRGQEVPEGKELSVLLAAAEKHLETQRRERNREAEL